MKLKPSREPCTCHLIQVSVHPGNELAQDGRVQDAGGDSALYPLPAFTDASTSPDAPYLPYFPAYASE
jgi:hypothetical protein